MNFIKRGFLGITRKKGKSLILLAVIFILGNLISGAISIQQATKNVEENIKERLGATATFEMDWMAYEELSFEEQENFMFEQIGVDLIEEVGSISYVKYYDYSMPTYLTSETTRSYYGEGMDDEEFMMYEPMGQFQVKGINYAPVLDFEEGKGNLVDGRVFTQDEINNGSSVTIISKKVAELNNLHVGDTFTLDNSIHDYDFETGEETVAVERDVVLEIIGIFESQLMKEDTDEDPNQGMMDWLDIDYQNTIYVANKVLSAENNFHMEYYMKNNPEDAEMFEEGGSFDYYEPIYVLNSHEDIEAFEQEVNPLLPQLYHVVSSGDHYDNIAGPVESMSSLSNYVLIAAVFATVLITGLVVLLFLRDRKHELGIYLSLGEQRGKVIGQILIEVLVVAFVGITLSLFTGNMLADQVSGTLMKADERSDYNDMMYPGDGIYSDLTTEDVLDSYEVTLDSSYIMVFYGVSMLTILISTLIPLVYIVRLNPKKILM